MSLCPRLGPLLQWSQTPRDTSRFNFPPSFYTSDLEESCICVPAATKRPSLIASQWKAETSHFLTQHAHSPLTQVQHGCLVFCKYCPPLTQPLHWQRGAFQIKLILLKRQCSGGIFFFLVGKMSLARAPGTPITRIYLRAFIVYIIHKLQAAFYAAHCAF